MSLLRIVTDTDSTLINVDLVKKISFKKRKELVDDEYVYFYELSYDDVIIQTFYFDEFETELTNIKNYTDAEYSRFFDRICNIVNDLHIKKTVSLIELKKYGWLRIKETFENITFSSTLIDYDILAISYQAAQNPDFHDYFWAVYYMLYKL